MTVDMSRYLGLFVSESTEHLDALARTLVALEKLPTEEVPAAVDALFRHAHSLKGMAASMGLEATAQLAHRAEDLLETLRSTRSRPARETVDLLLATADTLSAHVRAAAAGEVPGRAEALVRALEAARTTCAVGPAAAVRGTPPPAASAPAAPQPAAGDGAASVLPPRFAVKVQVVASCRVPGVRAFVLYRKMAALGNVFALSPPLDELKAGRLPRNEVALELETSASESQVAEVLAAIPEISLLSLARVVLAPSAVPAPTQPPPEPQGPRLLGAAESARTVRVRTELLDDLLDLAGELLITTAQVRELGRQLPEEQRAPVEEGVDRLHALVKGLHDRVMGARMTPIQVITDRLPRVARDVARRKGLEVELELSGTETELDRVILDELADPLLHLLRNCIDHGLESQAERAAAGKPATGRVRVEVRRERDRVLVEVSDDGRGMDAARLRAAAVERGLLTEAQASALQEAEAWMLCCLPGLSTAAEVSDISGRGVGMDAVKRAVEGVGGTLDIRSEAGKGTRFSLRLPLTVAVVNLLLAEVGTEVVGLPLSQVVGAVDAAEAPLAEQRGQRFMPRGDVLLPVYALGRLLGLPESPLGQRALLLAEAGPGGVVLEVDRLLGQQEVVLKALSRPLDAVHGLSGVTILGSGRPVFILDVPRLLAP
jgi:two-component system chemotaxis sensor kinase CheA